MDYILLTTIFGRDHGFAYQYSGSSNTAQDITVEFCTACENHLLDTSVVEMLDGTWTIWSPIELKNHDNFILIRELVEPTQLPLPEIQEPVESNPTGPTGAQ